MEAALKRRHPEPQMKVQIHRCERTKKAQREEDKRCKKISSPLLFIKKSMNKLEIGYSK